MLDINDIFLLNCRYIVRDLLGQGTFGQVVRCVREDSREEVAVKVIKNQTAFYHQVRSRALYL
jgi:dual specificity protein kinase YAK1